MASMARKRADLEYAYSLQMEEAIAVSMAAANLVEANLEEEEIHDKQEVEEAVEKGDGSVLDCDQEYDIEVRAVKTPEGHVGIGVMLTDPSKVLWQQSRYAGQGLSWHVAEYGGLLDAMEAAERLGCNCSKFASRLELSAIRSDSSFSNDAISRGLFCFCFCFFFFFFFLLCVCVVRFEFLDVVRLLMLQEIVNALLLLVLVMQRVTFSILEVFRVWC